MIRTARLFVAVLAASLPSAAFAQPVVHTIAEGIIRFDADAEAKAAALVSLSFEDSGVRETDKVFSNVLPRAPVFGRTPDGLVTVSIDLPDGTSLYGTGEAPGRLLRNGRVTTTWNTDSYAYNNQSPSLYQSHPWVFAVLPNGSSFGVLFDTTYRCRIDLNDGIKVLADGPEFPVIIFVGPKPQQVLGRLASVIGTITLPPKWALGYHQCRYSYYPDSRVREIADGFRSRDIPCDVIWMDIDYMDEFKVFTFDAELFPDPAGLNADLLELGFHNVWMIDPGIGDREGYFVRDQMREKNLAVLNADREPFVGDVWPGPCVFPDYMMAQTREWWAGLYVDFMGKDVSGVWNDMNEPAVFNVKSKTMPLDNIHRADEALGGEGSHARYHNVYGMYMIKATREGVMATNPDKRPFVLSRANFIGGHRYAATWTGDNIASWEQLEWSVPMTLNMGLSGQPFSGPDIGGFVGNGPEGAEGQLFARWMGIGSLMPFSRGHTGKGNIDKEPWAFGSDVEATCRRAISRRYVLLPYLYTLFWESSVNGLPVARPVFFADPADPALRSEDDAFLLGSDVLVVTQPTPLADRVGVKPRGIWAPINLDHVISGDSTDADLPELFLRGGAIIATGAVQQYVGQKPLDVVTLLVALDESGNASGVLYEDAGEGWGYRDGEFRVTRFSAKTSGKTVTITSKVSDGDWAIGGRPVQVRLINADGSVTIAEGIEGEPIKIAE